MAREARRISSTGMHKIKLRGERLFKNDEDKNVFSSMLEKYFAEGEVYGYDLSDTEIRLVVKEAPKGISMTMKPLTTSYARYFNRTYNSEGKLFKGRFQSEPIESDEEKDEAVKSLALPSAGTQKRKTSNGIKAAKKKGDTKNTRGEAKAALNTEPVIRKKGENKEEVKKISRREKMPSYLL